MNASAACLQDLQGNAVPLEHVAATGRLAGLLFELTVEQRYRNTSADTIETVYTFPLPVHAVLLSLELELAGTLHVARVAEKRAAARSYEQAVDDGNSAALLEDNGDGLYTVNIANVKPGETAVLRYRYAQLLAANEGYLRLQVPTAIAPRYGNPGDAGLDGAAVPTFDVLVDYPYTLALRLESLSDAGGIRSPSHRITVTKAEAGLAVTLAGRNALDRDVVIEIAQAALPVAARIARDEHGDGNSSVVLASPVLPANLAEQRPLCLKILLDCSGSMEGPRIAAARRALLAILARVTETDHLAIARFGSSVERVSEGLEPMDARTRDALGLLAQSFEADLGGTEMEEAVMNILTMPVPEGHRADLLLITDGEIHAVDDLVTEVANSGQRLFVIAIGEAPNEALARRVSEVSGGACEFIGDDELAEDAILRMVLRLRSAPRSIEALHWPGGAIPLWAAPLPTAVFPGETLHLFAAFATRPAGELQVTVRTADGRRQELVLAIAEGIDDTDLLPRVAAARRLPVLAGKDALAIALSYQLTSSQTSLVLVAERAEGEKAVVPPHTIVVPQMQGIVAESRIMLRRSARAPAVARMASMDVAECYIDLDEYDEVPDTSIASVRDLNPVPIDHEALRTALAAELRAGGRLPETVDELERIDAGRSPALIIELRELIGDFAFEEGDVVLTLLALLAEQAGAALEPELMPLLVHPILSSRESRVLRSWLSKALPGRNSR
jgi:Ca-activated chloride channel family protein